ncbi:glutathione S-transferase [Rhizodiscina lignyota]|uniref:Glutathione S-transferase n=1 Tax=Rhizodiscina lignyota TaxID=1504668 RepID=A0A9P4IK61_9PEZI|nr:glutathione S-transferase [Rhizodiscina lignyota]
MSKTITLYGHGPTANPVKVAIILEELGLPYEVKAPADIKAEPFISLNPNGRLPAIEDPNTGFNLFESGAIIEYLIRKYDTDAKLQYTTEPENFLTQSWLHFQMSGQGPYFGQLAWFKVFHKEQLPSAIERYGNEVKRVTGVIDAHLKKQKTKYLIGDKLTYADLAFVPWFNALGFILPEFDWKKETPEFAAWFEGLLSRQSVQTVLAKPEFQRQMKH